MGSDPGTSCCVTLSKLHTFLHSVFPSVQQGLCQALSGHAVLDPSTLPGGSFQVLHGYLSN